MVATSIEFTVNKTELLNIFFLGVRSRPGIFWIGVSFFVVLPFVAAAVFAIANFKGANIPWSSVGILVACPPLTVIGFALIPILLYGKSPMLRGVQRYTFSSEEIHLQNHAVDSRLKWSAFTGFSLGLSGCLLFSGKAAVLYIPGKALSHSVASELRELFESQRLKDVDKGRNA